MLNRRWTCIVFASIAFLTGGGYAWGESVNVSCQNAEGDASLLNSAISGSVVGDEIHIHGQCLINATVVLQGDRSYIGDSRTGTVLKATSSAIPAVLASDSWAADNTWTGGPVRLAHFTVSGPGGSGATAGIILRSWLTVVEDLQILNMPGDGLRITNLSQHGTALGANQTQVNGHIDNLLISGSGQNGIRIEDPGNAVTDWSLLDSWIANSGASAISMDNAAGWTLRGNHLYGVGQVAIDANRCFATTIEGNYIEDFGGAVQSGTAYGIEATVQGGAASVISGNKVFMLNGTPAAGAYVYIGVSAVNYGVGDLVVSNNAIRGAQRKTDIGLSFETGGGGVLNLYTGNNSVQDVTQQRRLGTGITLVPGF